MWHIEDQPTKHVYVHFATLDVTRVGLCITRVGLYISRVGLLVRPVGMLTTRFLV